MIIDCDTCEVRGDACGDCVIGVLLGAPGTGGQVGPGEPEVGSPPSGAPTVQLDAPERRALEVLAAQGLVPRLRLVAGPARRTTSALDDQSAARDAG
jgi:hypothetical protein